MTAREKKLATAVGVIVAIIINYLLIEFFIKNQQQLTADLKRRTAELELKRALLEEKEIWEQRSAWTQAHQPTLPNLNLAGVTLLDAVKEVAKKNLVLMQSPTIGTPEKRPHCISVSVNFETLSTWEALCGFLREMQGPEQFIVFESANVKVDTNDKTRMNGRFRVAKWFAPK